MFTTAATRTARQIGYSYEFLRTTQAKRRTEEREAITYLAKAEMRRQGIVSFKRRGLPQWALEIMEEVSGRLDVCPSELAGSSRLVRVVNARNEIIYLIKKRKPTLSSSQIGKWFSRNHVSILYALASHAERNKLPELCGYDIEHSRKVKRERAAQKVLERKQADTCGG